MGQRHPRGHGGAVRHGGLDLYQGQGDKGHCNLEYAKLISQGALLVAC
jgi:hypothetical protein